MISLARSGSRLLALSLGLLSACGGGGGGGGGSGPATLLVRMQDTPVDAAEHVYVTVDRVEVFHPGTSGEVKETLVSTPAQYDLLALQNGVSTVLGSGQFPAGDYTSIRLIVGADSKQDLATLPADQLKNYIVIDGIPYPLIVPSGAQTGLKIDHAFSLADGETTTLTLDFDVRKSVHQRGHQGIFNLTPTLCVIETQASGTISGTLSTSDGSPLPTGTVVSAQVGGVEAASAMADVTTGSYQLGPLPAGTYDLIVIAPGYGFAYQTGVVVLAQQDSPGYDFPLAAAALGTLSGSVAFSTTDPTAVTVRLMWNGLQVAATGIDSTTGAYGFGDVPVGDYTVTAGDGTNSTSGSGTVANGGSTTVDLTLP